MAFCGHCGYQLSKGDKACPQCGAETDLDLAEYTSPDPETRQPTEISHAILDYSQAPAAPQNPGYQTRFPTQQPQGPLVLGQSGSEQMSNEATTMMSAQMSAQLNSQANSQPYQPQQPYPGYQQPQMGPGTGFYNPGGYNPAAGYQQPQSAQSVTVERLLESSRKGKTASLLLILLGLLLLIGAILIFLLNQQGIIFS
jgi:hypothetical protein